MNGVATTGINRGWPATAVLKLASDRPVRAREPQCTAGDELLLASVRHSPRIGQAQPIAALMPQVLARYGLAEASSCEVVSAETVDVLS
jgi:hypothetical protein